MDRMLLAVLMLVLSFQVKAQAFKDKELLKYRVHYGLLNAGFATLTVDEVKHNGQPHFHVVGKGSSSGAVRAFFKVDDRYESYIDKYTFLPSKAIRKVKEGSHEKDRILTFDHTKKVVKYEDLKGKKVSYVRFTPNIQDMISAFYYLRTKPNSEFKTGSFLHVDVFMDGEVYPFKLKVEGREKIKTSFGYINAIKLKPYVQKGRIFEGEESVNFWVSDDHNLIPLKIKASLAVGSIEVDLNEYKNLKFPINFSK